MLLSEADREDEASPPFHLAVAEYRDHHVDVAMLPVGTMLAAADAHLAAAVDWAREQRTPYHLAEGLLYRATFSSAESDPATTRPRQRCSMNAPKLPSPLGVRLRRTTRVSVGSRGPIG